MKFVIVGCGLIGQKRARALRSRGHSVLVAVDFIPERAEALAEQYPGASHSSDWRQAVCTEAADAVVVATTNEWLATVTSAAIRGGKHVFVEKPAARSVAEVDAVINEARNVQLQVQVGFNHRYHPALQMARKLCDSSVLGPLLFVRGRYGHGGRLGYEKEWRANREISGGGELIDQGVHLIDLARWFLGDFTRIEGHASTYFWDMAVDDNAFLSLRTADERTAWLHVSCTEWKNLFSLEIYGRDGKIDIQGLGGSYGVERIAFYKMLPRMGPPETTIWEYPGEDNSWASELDDFAKSIISGSAHGPTLCDAKAALSIVETIYKTA